MLAHILIWFLALGQGSEVYLTLTKDCLGVALQPPRAAHINMIKLKKYYLIINSWNNKIILFIIGQNKVLLKSIAIDVLIDSKTQRCCLMDSVGRAVEMHTNSIKYQLANKNVIYSLLASVLLDVWFCNYTHAQLRILKFQDSVLLKSEKCVQGKTKRYRENRNVVLFCNSDNC